MENKQQGVVEPRSILRKSFKDPIFSLVPYEIWRDIVCFADIKSIANISQTCKGFKELAQNFGKSNVNLALFFRKEGQIALGLKHLFLCANNGNVTAMFHLGYFLWYSGGWGLTIDLKSANEWAKKASEGGNGAAMILYAYFCRHCVGCDKDDKLCQVWAKKAISTGDHFALGLSYLYEIGNARDFGKSLSAFNLGAESDNEFCEYWLGEMFNYGFGLEKNLDRAFYWYSKAAEQGNYDAQMKVSQMLREGRGCAKSAEKANIWFKKFKNQQSRKP